MDWVSASMRIAIDLDSTVINTVETLIDYINERVPVNLKIDDVTSYNIEAALPEQYRWIVEAGFRDKLMWKKVSLLPFCAEVIKRLYNEGHEVWFATASLPENLHKKINHLSRNMQFFPEGYVWRHTINIQDKYLLDVDILIDDCLKHAAHPLRNYLSIVPEYPWNVGSDVREGIWWAKDWHEIYNLVKMIELKGDNI